MSGVEPGLCNQRHLRELQGIIEHDQEDWADEMKGLLCVTLRCRHLYGDNVISAAGIEWLAQIYTGKQGRQAERDLRMMKRKPEIFVGFRSIKGAEQFAPIRGFISKVHKQGCSPIPTRSILCIWSRTFKSAQDDI